MKNSGLLINGKRLDEHMKDIPFMTAQQMHEFYAELAQVLASMGIELYTDNEDADDVAPVFELIGYRYEALEKVDNVEVEAGIKTGKFIRNGANVYERNVPALVAMRAMFGHDLIKEVFVDRKHLEHLQKSGDMNNQERIIDTFINNDELLELDISGMGMIVEFTNGRIIEMTNSEWGGFTKLR